MCPNHSLFPAVYRVMAQFRGRLVSDPGPRFDTAKVEALKALVRAADEWSKGDPTLPDPSEVLEAIIDAFAKAKFIRRPYGSGP
jgi:hypothetical protein